MLSNWIDPTPAKQYINKKNNSATSFLEDNTLVNIGLSSKIAIIGHGRTTDLIRKTLYDLDLSLFKEKITDLGDIRNNDIGLMTSAYKELLSQNIFPIVIDSSINSSISIANALKLLEYDTSFGLICPSTAQSSDFYSIYSELVENQKARNISILAFQKHFSNPLHKVMPKLDLSGLLSLGKIRDDIKEAEPILRNLDLLAFDLKSIKSSDSSGLKNQKNIGLYAEESCKLLQYASSSSKLKAIHLSGFEIDEHKNSMAGAELISCLIWYCFKGRNNVKANKQTKSEMTNFIVDLDSWDQQLNFWKNEKSEHWWVEIPSHKNDNEGLVPCSESEYKLAKTNKISDRLFHILSSY